MSMSSSSSSSSPNCPSRPCRRRRRQRRRRFRDWLLRLMFRGWMALLATILVSVIQTHQLRVLMSLTTTTTSSTTSSSSTMSYGSESDMESDSHYLHPSWEGFGPPPIPILKTTTTATADATTADIAAAAASAATAGGQYGGSGSNSTTNTLPSSSSSTASSQRPSVQLMGRTPIELQWILEDRARFYELWYQTIVDRDDGDNRTKRQRRQQKRRFQKWFDSGRIDYESSTEVVLNATYASTLPAAASLLDVLLLTLNKDNSTSNNLTSNNRYRGSSSLLLDELPTLKELQKQLLQRQQQQQHHHHQSNHSTSGASYYWTKSTSTNHNTTHNITTHNHDHEQRHHQHDHQFPLLDFLILGFPKCGTTTLMANLAHQVAPMPVQDVCRPGPLQLLEFAHRKWTTTTMTTTTGAAGGGADGGERMLPPLRGSKCPRYLNSGEYRALSASYPQARFIIGIRHPVLWFQSFWRMQGGPGPYKRLQKCPCRPSLRHDGIRTCLVDDDDVEINNGNKEDHGEKKLNGVDPRRQPQPFNATDPNSNNNMSRQWFSLRGVDIGDVVDAEEDENETNNNTNTTVTANSVTTHQNSANTTITTNTRRRQQQRRMWCPSECPEDQLFCVARARFHLPLAELGKTALTPQERQWLAPDDFDGGIYYVQPAHVPNPIFLYDQTQLQNETVWTDLATFLGISHIDNVHYHGSRGKDKSHLDICHAKFDVFRAKHMMPYCYQLSQWLLRYLVPVARDPSRKDVVIADVDEFVRIVTTYQHDPCHRLVLVVDDGIDDGALLPHTIRYVLDPALTLVNVTAKRP